MTFTDIHRGVRPDVRGFEYDRIDGGTLVYVVESGDSTGPEGTVPTERRLYGFADVTDWSAIRAELGRRGHDVGAVHHLPTLR